MHERERRDFLKLGLMVGASMVGWPYLNRLFPRQNPVQSSEHLQQNLIDFRFIGPNINSFTLSGGSDGERCIWADPNNSNKILIGTWDYGFWSTCDGGANWNRENIPTNNFSENLGGDPDIQRDIVPISGSSQLVISDYSASVRDESSGSVNWRDLNAPCNSGFIFMQTGEIADGNVLLGGYGFNGIYSAPLSDLYSATDKSVWHRSSGAEAVMIRSIKYDERTKVIYAGGWGNGTNNPMVPGTGLLMSVDKGKTFINSPYFDQVQDLRGPLAINTIEIAYVNGHQFLIVGGEGSGTQNGRRYSSDFPFLHIFVDGYKIPSQSLNLDSLAITGGADIVSPQRGIVISESSNKIYVSTYSQGVSSASLDDILNGRVIWEKAALPPNGNSNFGAVHLRPSRNLNGNPQLVVGRQIWGNNVAFQQAAIGDINTAVTHNAMLL